MSRYSPLKEEKVPPETIKARSLFVQLDKLHLAGAMWEEIRDGLVNRMLNEAKGQVRIYA